MPGTGGHPGLSVPAPGHHRRSGCAHGSVHRWPCCLSAPALAIGSIPSFPERTTWSRALEALGVTQILAHSPQAKGRVERAKGTFQDRLVAELRLAGASTLEEANQVLSDFLPRFNQRFGARCPARISLPSSGPRAGPGWRAVYQGVAPGGQRQHGAIPWSPLATLSQSGAAQLRWSPGRGTGTSGGAYSGTASGEAPDSSGSATSSCPTAGSGGSGSGRGGTVPPRPDRLGATATRQSTGNPRTPGWGEDLV